MLGKTMKNDPNLIKHLRSAMHARGAEAHVPGTLRNAQGRKSDTELSMNDDGFHFSEYQDHSHKLFYVEWWYYNFCDPATGLTGMVTFAICNPGNELDLGTASLNFAIFEPGKDVVTDIEFFHVTHFTAVKDSADVSIAQSSVQVKDDNTYHIKAISETHDIKFDLVFEKKAPAQLLANNVPGYSDWEISSWLVYMPSAKVTGTVYANGKTTTLANAKGYHDHDWGMWMLPERIWSWSQFSTDDHRMAFDIGFHAAFQKSTAYMMWDDKNLYFPQDNFKTQQSDWEAWRLFWKYPTKVQFSSVDSTGQYELKLIWDVTQTSTLWKYPLIVFEQACQFKGELCTYDANNPGGGTVLETIDTEGFCEYTDRWVG